jgi:hypothetical protein
MWQGRGDARRLCVVHGDRMGIRGHIAGGVDCSCRYGRGAVGSARRVPREAVGRRRDRADHLTVHEEIDMVDAGVVRRVGVEHHVAGDGGAVGRRGQRDGRGRDRVVTGGRAGVGERLSRHREELPVVARGVEGELEDSPGLAVADLAVGLHLDDVVGAAAPSRADDELADALRGVRRSGGRLGREALIDVAMAVQDHVGSGGIQVLPERLKLRGGGFGGVGRTEQGTVEVGEGAGRRMRGEVGLEPLLLR